MISYASYIARRIAKKATHPRTLKSKNIKWSHSSIGRMLVLRHAEQNPDTKFFAEDIQDPSLFGFKESILHANDHFGRPVSVQGDTASLNMVDWSQMEKAITKHVFDTVPGIAMPYDRVVKQMDVKPTLPYWLPQHGNIWLPSPPLCFAFFMVVNILLTIGTWLGLCSKETHHMAFVCLAIACAIPVIISVAGLFAFQSIRPLAKEVSSNWDQVFQLKTEADAVLVSMLSTYYRSMDTFDTMVQFSAYTPEQAMLILGYGVDNDYSSGQDVFYRGYAGLLFDKQYRIYQQEQQRIALAEKTRICMQTTAPQFGDKLPPEEATPPEHLNAYADDPVRTRWE